MQNPDTPKSEGSSPLELFTYNQFIAAIEGEDWRLTEFDDAISLSEKILKKNKHTGNSILNKFSQLKAERYLLMVDDNLDRFPLDGSMPTISGKIYPIPVVVIERPQKLQLEKKLAFMDHSTDNIIYLSEGEGMSVVRTGRMPVLVVHVPSLSGFQEALANKRSNNE